MLLKLRSVRPSRRLGVSVTALVFTVLFFSLMVSDTRLKASHYLRKQWATDTGVSQSTGDEAQHGPGSAAGQEKDNIHILMPATQSNVHMCKTLLTMTILGYPNPHIVAWGDQDNGDGLLGGGSHYAKISRTLDYINDEERRKKPGFDDELVLMIDSYDIWFQLPLEVLIARFQDILKQERKRIAHGMGNAYSQEGIHPMVVFGGGKRCSPNEIQTLACFPVPESPLPYDLYKGNTDTLMGRNMHSSFRTRYLNSGYIIGKVRDIRPLFARASEKLEECKDRTGAWFDNGYGWSDNCYKGSDQSIFVEMFGEQEVHREVMRRHHRGFLDGVLDRIFSGRAGSRPPPTHILDAPVRDMLNPEFSHQDTDPTYLPGQPHEFGMSIDYWSTLGHQTSNAESDSRYIRHNEPLAPQVGDQFIWDCPAKAPMPKDLSNDVLKDLLGDEEPNRWETMPLYTEICVGTVPVMIHHNSIDKAQREIQWDRTWWHGRARKLLELREWREAPQLIHGISTDKGGVVTWDQLCPRDVEAELFRDVEPEPEPKPDAEMDMVPEPEQEPAE